MQAKPNVPLMLFHRDNQHADLTTVTTQKGLALRNLHGQLIGERGLPFLGAYHQKDARPCWKVILQNPLNGLVRVPQVQEVINH